MEVENFKELKKLEAIVQRIDRDADSVVVEGFMDRKALRKLGFTGKVFLSAERTVEDLAEDVSRGAEKVVILTDFDEHGKEANRQILQHLQPEVDVIKSSREEFGSQLTSTGRRTIEATMPLFSSLEDKFVEAALDGLFFKN